MGKGDSADDQEFAANYPGTPVTAYQFCRQAARDQTTTPRWVYYTDVNTACGLGLDYGNIADRNKIANMLGDVSEFEVKKGRPMLSALVVLKGGKPPTPGQGFLDWAAHLGVVRWAGQDDQQFHARVLGDVLSYWSQHP